MFKDLSFLLLTEDHTIKPFDCEDEDLNEKGIVLDRREIEESARYFKTLFRKEESDNK